MVKHIKSSETRNPYIFDPKVDKVEWRKPTPIERVERVANEIKQIKENHVNLPSQAKVRSVGRLAKPYEGKDVLSEWHRDKMKSSSAEAFKGADYAIAVEGHPSEWQDFIEFVGGMAILAPFIFVACYLAFIILKALGIVVVL